MATSARGLIRYNLWLSGCCSYPHLISRDDNNKFSIGPLSLLPHHDLIANSWDIIICHFILRVEIPLFRALPSKQRSIHSHNPFRMTGASQLRSPTDFNRSSNEITSEARRRPSDCRNFLPKHLRTLGGCSAYNRARQFVEPDSQV